MTELKKIKVLLADDHPLMRVALKHILETQDNLEVVGEAENGALAVDLALKLKPDIVVMDISMPELNGLEATRKIKAAAPDIGILILTVHTDNEHVFNILQAGADGYLTKSASTGEVISAINALATGESVLSSAISKQVYKYLFQYMSKPLNLDTSDRLSQREQELLKLLAKGLANKEISARLGLSLHTVKSYLADLFSKMKVTSRTEAVVVGLRKGILTSDDIE
jgi:two-component system, NarL family, response regulator LiaR